ncbi:MAG: T9SS C-terminal target domain-containing protein [Bacteroidetes bacterium]|nr:MAG: T9SS C-terminal target domain-containing protein [Bacteroidota bacterium]
MNKLVLQFTALLLLILSAGFSPAQVVVTEPEFPTDLDSCVVFFDATQGNGGLADVPPPLYAHTGVITNLSTSPTDWKYVVAAWNENILKAQLIPLGDNLWELRIIPSIREYYGVPAGEVIQQLAFVFRNADGSRSGRNEDGSDIFADVYPATLSVNIILPDQKELLLLPGDSIPVLAKSPLADSLLLYRNDTLLKSVAGTVISDTLPATTSSFWTEEWIRIVAKNDTGSVADSFSYRVIPPPPVAELPAGVIDGINYVDPETAILSLYAPEKSYCFAIGDFTNWKADSLFYMNLTPDGTRYWIRLNNLTPLQEYRFQYFVDGTLRVGDPYADKVSDPNDIYITSATYPNLIPYPTGLTTGIATILQTGQKPYPWDTASFDPPDVSDLVIYELLLRDFTAAHTFNSLADTLDYLSRLGVNAIELMPIMEFEGNSSWGYNPDFSYAVDKYYGPKNTFKQLVDAAHEKGIAVILDIVCNHQFGQSPLVMLYWDPIFQRPAANNPWFNQIPKHPFNVGYDFNHESGETRQYMDRLIRYWLEEYHVDGYRFDLSKGFTQKDSYPNNVSLWGQYDASRIAILNHYDSVIRSVNPLAYNILEHFADNSEEKVLAASGMMLWGNMTGPYAEGAMGWNQSGKSDFSWASYQARGWASPHLVAYMESHDEERMMFKNISYGNATLPPYNVKDTFTALKRVELAANFYFTIPGPKMIWEFGELGYDFSINYPTGTAESRLAPKPIRWDYYTEWRRRYLYNVFSSLIALKKEEPAFVTDDFTLHVAASMKSVILRHADMDVVVLGNFDVEENGIIPNFTKPGIWYEYWTGDSLSVSDPADPLQLQPGEYRLYTTKKFVKPPFTGIRDPGSGNLPEPPAVLFYPNPTSGRITIESQEKELDVTIVEPGGRTVLYKHRAGTGTGISTLDISRLSPGIYFIRFEAPGKKPIVEKIIKY